MTTETTLKESGRYKLVDARGTIKSSSYQLLEYVIEEERWETCGEYTNMKDATKAFNECNKLSARK